MSRSIDLENWKRFPHFKFFKDYEFPFFSVCANVDVTALRALTREKGYSFFIAYHYLSLKAANEIDEFRYRLREDGVAFHERVHGGTTLLLPGDIFTLAYFDFDDDFTVFNEQAGREVARRRSGEVELFGRMDRDDMIYHSVHPWMSFTGLTHARSNRSESVPKVVFGGYREEHGRLMLPISVEGHHAVMDAVHVAKFFSLLGKWFAEPSSGGIV